MTVFLVETPHYGISHRQVLYQRVVGTTVFECRHLGMGPQLTLNEGLETRSNSSINTVRNTASNLDVWKRLEEAGRKKA
jgi:hypothetical protein